MVVGDDYVFVIGQVYWVVFGVFEGVVGYGYVVDLGFQCGWNVEVVYWCVDYYDVGFQELLYYLFSIGCFGGVGFGQ